MISKLKNSGAALFIIGAALFLYILLRAFLVSFTHDEGLTVMEYATQPWTTINDVNWTNNHLLNTWLCRLNLDLFGPSEFSFRWPNVFAGLLYIVFGAKLLRKFFSDNWICVVAFLALICNTFLVDFFGLCRGYGLSMGLLMTGLYYFFRYFETGKILKYGTTSLILFGLATIANYTLLNFFLLQAGFFMFHVIASLITIKSSWKQKLPKIISFIFVGLTTYFFTAWFIRLMLKMRETGNFNFGGEAGFWKNTVSSLIDFSCGPLVHPVNLFYVVLTWVALGLFVMSAGIIFTRLIKQKFTPLNWFSVFLFMVIFGCASAIWLQNHLLNVPFSTDRAALYFLVLFPLLLAICFFTPGKLPRLRKFFAGIFLAFPVISFSLSVNLDRTLLWPFNAHTKEAVEKIIEDSRDRVEDGSQARVAIAFLQYPVYNYYIYAEKANWLNFIAFGETDFQIDADYYLRLDNIEAAPPKEYKVIWEGYGKHLYHNEREMKIREIKNLGKFDFEQNDGRPKASGYSGKYSELINNHLIYSQAFSDTLTDTLFAGTIISCDLNIWPDDVRTRAKLVIDGADGQNHFWKGIYISWFLHNEKQWNKINFWYKLRTDVLPGERINVYMMNDSDVDLRLDDFAVRYLDLITKD